MNLNDLNQAVKDLATAKKIISEMREELKTLQLAENELKLNIEKALRESGTDAWKVKDVATVGIRKNKSYYKVTNEKALVSALEGDKGLAKEYLATRPNELFLNALKAGVEWELEGLEKVESDSFYIRVNKEKK